MKQSGIVSPTAVERLGAWCTRYWRHVLLVLLVGDLGRDIVLTLGMPGLTRQERLAHLMVLGLCLAARGTAMWFPRMAMVLALPLPLFALGVAGPAPAATTWAFIAVFVSAAPLYMALRYLGGMIICAVVGVFLAAAHHGDWSLFVSSLGPIVGGIVVVWTLGHLGYTAVQHYRREQRLADARGQLSLASTDDIAQHLHDEIGHSLTYISLETSVHGESDDPVELREALERVQETTEHASTQLRDLLTLLMDGRHNGPWSQDRLDPEATLAFMINQLRDCGWRVKLRRDDAGTPLVEPARSVAAKGIREACANIVKHAAPFGAVSIVVSDDDGSTTVEITSPLAAASEPPVASTQMGLRNLGDAADAIGGSLQAEQRGKVWYFRLSVPTNGGLRG